MRKAATAVEAPQQAENVIDLSPTIAPEYGVIDLDPYYPEKLHDAIQKAQKSASIKVTEAAIDLVLNDDDDFDREDLLESLADTVHSYLEVAAIHNAYAEHISVPANNGTTNKN